MISLCTTYIILLILLPITSHVKKILHIQVETLYTRQSDILSLRKKVEYLLLAAIIQMWVARVDDLQENASYNDWCNVLGLNYCHSVTVGI